MENQLKKQLMQNYLSQQNTLIPSAAGSIATEENAIVLYNELLENITLDEFKKYVRKWFEYDNFIKKAQLVIKEKRQQRDRLSEVITKFMIKYDIEDLNTKEGRIRCKTGYKKAPVNQKVVKERITDYFKTNEQEKVRILEKVFEDRGKIEQVSLRRLKIT